MATIAWRCLRSAAGLLMLAGLSACASASPAAQGLTFQTASVDPAQTATSIMPSYGQAPPPAGYVAFCQRLPDQCVGPVFTQALADEPGLRPLSQNSAGHFDWSSAFAADSKPAPASAAPGAHAVTLSAGLWSRMQTINRSINQKIIPANDVEAFGVADYWAMPLTEGRGVKGNCKHYVVEKREALLKAGVPAEALNIAVARTPWGEIHAVLLVETDAGDYVLDSLSPWITLWHQTGYTWLQRQVDGQASHWAKVA
jgi:predicted transglutaminase-like cysteine proteinase